MPLQKKKKKQEDGETVDLDISTSFDVADAKDEDFELSMDSARFTGSKGQAGSRTKTSG